MHAAQFRYYDTSLLLQTGRPQARSSTFSSLALMDHMIILPVDLWRIIIAGMRGSLFDDHHGDST